MEAVRHIGPRCGVKAEDATKTYHYNRILGILIKAACQAVVNCPSASLAWPPAFDLRERTPDEEFAEWLLIWAGRYELPPEGELAPDSLTAA